MASGRGSEGGVASAISIDGKDDSTGSGSESATTGSSITGSNDGATGSGSGATVVSSLAAGAIGAGSTEVSEGTGSSSKNRLADPFAEMSCDAEAGASGSMSAEQTKSTAARN